MKLPAPSRRSLAARFGSVPRSSLAWSSVPVKWSFCAAQSRASGVSRGIQRGTVGDPWQQRILMSLCGDDASSVDAAWHGFPATAFAGFTEATCLTRCCRLPGSAGPQRSLSVPNEIAHDLQKHAKNAGQGLVQVLSVSLKKCGFATSLNPRGVRSVVASR